MWECLHCGEKVEEVFDVCWKCQANRDGAPSELPDPVRDEAEEEEIASLNREPTPRDCLRCRQAMKYAGTRRLYDGTNRGVLGEWDELFVKRLSLELYVCPACLHVEFFASDTRL